MNRACENDAVAIGVHGGSNLLSSPFFLGLVTPVYGELKVVPLNFVSSNLPRVFEAMELGIFDMFLSSGAIHKRCGRKISSNKQFTDVLRDPQSLVD